MIEFQENISLADHVHYRLGGPARYFVTVTTVEELQEALMRARELQQKIFILGSGTNLLISEHGFDGVVIHPAIRFLRTRGDVIEAGAGTLMSELVTYAMQEEKSGLEWAGGLPGTVGGAVRGNAGAFGGETKDAIAEVTTVNVGTGAIHTWPYATCHFGYRSSVFKEQDGEEVIVSAAFRLVPADADAIFKAVQEKIDYRTTRHPMEYPNIGSIFKNVPVHEVPENVLSQVNMVIKNDPFPVVPVAYLISECGLKGTRIGGAEISSKHPNFIVNIDHATANDVEALIARAKKEVKEKFSIIIEEEVMKI